MVAGRVGLYDVTPDWHPLLGPVDIDGQPRTMGPAPDIGADEFTEASAGPSGGGGTGTTLGGLPLFLLLAYVAALGVGLWVSAANVKYRDISYVIPFLTQFMLFLTPVVYPITLVPEGWRAVYSLNPMTGVVEGFRWALLGTHADPFSVLVSAVSCEMRTTLVREGWSALSRESSGIGLAISPHS